MLKISCIYGKNFIWYTVRFWDIKGEAFSQILNNFWNLTYISFFKSKVELESMPQLQLNESLSKSLQTLNFYGCGNDRDLYLITENDLSKFMRVNAFRKTGDLN